ncbi:unnamed protein product [Cladocopium goreaui]|uniref:Calcium-dependent protein kinase 2 n=1 Tax=Cladocopium goreaui TaxID=2562237 RepID=A0A9P1CL98_9DINO|nr:unnamed protein product [Cladocopium goreaui]
MQWTCIRLFIVVYSLQISRAAYLSNVAVELLAPPAGQETYLWIGFRTSNTTSSTSSYSKSEDFPYHSLLIQEESESSTQQILSFAANCSSLVELAGGWPGSIACHGGFFQFDGVLSAATWYELVILVNISSSAIRTSGSRLRLLVGRLAFVPVPAKSFQNQVRCSAT